MSIEFTVDEFRLIQVILAAFLWMVAMVCSHDYMKEKEHKIRYYLFSVATFLATAGVFLGKDFYTIFIFFEIMSFTSFVWVIQEETKKSIQAANTYLAIAVLGGLVMLMGIFLYYGTDLSGSLKYISGICMLFGFGAKAGIFFLHIWMRDSYDKAPAPASALLSAVLSKTGVFGIILVTKELFLGDELWAYLILVLAALTMFFGAVCAIFSIEMKQILAFSSMSQIGFILVGVGMYGLLGEHGAIAIRGTVLHMMNHSLVKVILFIIAGYVLLQAKSLNLNDIKGVGRGKAGMHLLFLAAYLGITGVPFWNGYISKSLLHESIVEGIHLGMLSGSFLNGLEMLFLFCGGCTIAYMTKIYVALFWESKEESAKAEGSYISKLSGALLGTVAVAITAFGIVPNVFDDFLMDKMQVVGGSYPVGEKISYFSLEMLKGALISIVIGILLYAVVVRLCLMNKEKEYRYVVPKWVSLENTIYKPVFIYALPAVCGFFSRIADSLVDSIVVFIRKTVLRDEKLPFELEEGTWYTYYGGLFADKVRECFYRYKKKEEAPKDSFTHIFAKKYTEYRLDQFIIARSMSFGLLMFCIGLGITLIYILISG